MKILRILFIIIFSLYAFTESQQQRYIPYYELPEPYISTNLDSAQLVDISDINPEIILDIKYASDSNFVQTRLYELPKCYLRKNVAKQLDSVEQYLRKKGYRLIVYDGYRPYSVSKKMYELSPNKLYVAHPRRGSNHSRAVSVDAGLADILGTPLDMGTEHDAFTGKSARTYTNLSDEALKNRKILSDAFLRFGFYPLPSEWWHFDFKGSRTYPLLDIPFDEIEPYSEFQKDIHLNLIHFFNSKFNREES